MSDQEQSDGAEGDGGTSDDDRQPDDTGATGTLGDHDLDDDADVPD